MLLLGESLPEGSSLRTILCLGWLALLLGLGLLTANAPGDGGVHKGAAGAFCAAVVCRFALGVVAAAAAVQYILVTP